MLRYRPRNVAAAYEKPTLEIALKPIVGEIGTPNKGSATVDYEDLRVHRGAVKAPANKAGERRVLGMARHDG